MFWAKNRSEVTRKAEASRCGAIDGQARGVSVAGRKRWLEFVIATAWGCTCVGCHVVGEQPISLKELSTSEATPPFARTESGTGFAATALGGAANSARGSQSSSGSAESSAGQSKVGFNRFLDRAFTRPASPNANDSHAELSANRRVSPARSDVRSR